MNDYRKYYLAHAFLTIDKRKQALKKSGIGTPNYVKKSGPNNYYEAKQMSKKQTVPINNTMTMKFVNQKKDATQIESWKKGISDSVGRLNSYANMFHNKRNRLAENNSKSLLTVTTTSDIKNLLSTEQWNLIKTLYNDSISAITGLTDLWNYYVDTYIGEDVKGYKHKTNKEWSKELDPNNILNLRHPHNELASYLYKYMNR